MIFGLMKQLKFLLMTISAYTVEKEVKTLTVCAVAFCSVGLIFAVVLLLTSYPKVSVTRHLSDR